MANLWRTDEWAYRIVSAADRPHRPSTPTDHLPAIRLAVDVASAAPGGHLSRPREPMVAGA
jgi:hypothetical protein